MNATDRDRLLPRFWAKVNKTETCWLWTARIAWNGYGVLYYPHIKRARRAHRFAYEAFVGDVPGGLVLDHTCRVRHCVNPAHLEPVTIGENVARGLAVRAATCANGHEMIGDNLRFDRKGWRKCRTCHRESMRRYVAAAKARRVKGEFVEDNTEASK